MMWRQLLTFSARLLLLAALVPSVAHAGPPFLNDDPQPTDTRQWEIYNFLSGTRAQGETSLTAGLDLNYGPAPDIQLTATVPVQRAPGEPLTAGDVELAAKLRLLHQSDSGINLAVFPRLFLPTGRGSERARLLLPVWVQRDIGTWQVFGGGGYMLNPGAGNRNAWQGGIALSRPVARGVQLGVEYFAQGAAGDDDRPLQVLNLGALVHLHGPFSLIGSFGQGLNHRETLFYSALKLDL